jgi:hypothetical protein
LELLAAGSSGSSDGSSSGSSDGDKIPVNRDGEPEPASHRWGSQQGEWVAGARSQCGSHSC